MGEFQRIVHLEARFRNRNFVLAALPASHAWDSRRVRLFPPAGLADSWEVGRYLVADSLLSLRRQVAGGLVIVTGVTGSSTPSSPWRASIQLPYSCTSYRDYTFAYDLAGLDLCLRDNIPFRESFVRFDDSGFEGQNFPPCIVTDTPVDLKRMVEGVLETHALTEVVYRPDIFKPFQGFVHYSRHSVCGHVAYLVSDFRDECSLVYQVPCG